jgi:threonine dehydratase
VGLEILAELGDEPDAVVVPCGGGGLAGGIALALAHSRIVAVEPEGWDDMRRSLELGRIVPVDPNAPPTLCDALQTPRVSPITFGIFQERGVQVVTVSDAEVAAAVRFAWRNHQLFVEPGGAAALAAVMAGKVRLAEDSVIVLSGGNVDPALHARIVAG